MRAHFIAIGGSAMHNLAIALKIKGDDISGSDDEIFEPSRSRLDKYGLLPEKEGWFPEKIDSSLDAVILGMHAKADNPELLKALDLKIPVYSYPEYLYEQSKNKTRVVIGGSHGKTTITSMILHVMSFFGKKCDYMVGAQLDGFEVMVKMTEEAKYMVLEGDEYLTSPLDKRPKFHLYKPDIALISGIAWDHINVFPTFDNYLDQFKIFADLITTNGKLIYCSEDENVNTIGKAARTDIEATPYSLPKYLNKNGQTYLDVDNEKIPLQIFGKHNLLNLNGARLVCNQMGISDQEFYQAIHSFSGASKRLEKVGESESSIVFKDFAHAPSKLKATINAVKEQFPDRKLVACLELHTYSSLNHEFLSQYTDTMSEADEAIVYFNPHAIKLKRLPDLKSQTVKESFGRNDLVVYNQSSQLRDFLLNKDWKNTNLLMMSSGNFDGIDIVDLAERLLEK